MEFTAILLFLLTLPVALLAQVQESTQSLSLVFTHITIIDATGRLAQPDMTVVITKERFATLLRQAGIDPEQE